MCAHALVAKWASLVLSLGQHDCTGITDLSPLADQFESAVLKSSVSLTFINILMIVK